MLYRTVFALFAAASIIPATLASDHGMHQADHSAHSSELHIMNGWVRALPPTQTVTAAYLTLHNASDAALTIDQFSADIAETVELHDSVLEGGQMRMVREMSLDLGVDEHKTLQPAGLHLMLMKLASMPREGDSVTVCVGSSELKSCKALPVLKIAPSGSDSPAHTHH